MNIVQIRWIVVGSLALGLSACDVHVGKCDRDDAGDCVDLFPDDEDAGDEEDAGALDGGRADGGRSDGGRSDGGVDGGAGEGGSDGGGGTDGSAEPLTLEQFCEAQFATAVLWRDAFENHCDNDNISERDEFLGKTFAYSPDTAVDGCIDRFDSSNITFDGSLASACAQAFSDQFPAPPDAFPETGIDLSTYASMIGHGASTLFQLPECRAALKGKLAQDDVCTNSLECRDGLRCRPAPGDTSTCQTALKGGVCRRTSECADGYTCVGSSAGAGKTCIPSDDLPITGNCELSIECAEGRVCNDAGSCAAPTPDVICVL
jgi:hypothetical protein